MKYDETCLTFRLSNLELELSQEFFAKKFYPGSISW